MGQTKKTKSTVVLFKLHNTCFTFCACLWAICVSGAGGRIWWDWGGTFYAGITESLERSCHMESYFQNVCYKSYMCLFPIRGMSCSPHKCLITTTWVPKLGKVSPKKGKWIFLPPTGRKKTKKNQLPWFPFMMLQYLFAELTETIQDVRLMLKQNRPEVYFYYLEVASKNWKVIQARVPANTDNLITRIRRFRFQFFLPAF